MKVGDVASAKIQANPYWNFTGIRLVAGKTYSFSTHGTWIDFFAPSTPDGYDAPWWLWPVLLLLQPFRRAPRVKWFTLIGAVDSARYWTFRIGVNKQLVAPATGTLLCFANDVPFAYFNNRGSVDLTVTRIA